MKIFTIDLRGKRTNHLPKEFWGVTWHSFTTVPYAAWCGGRIWGYYETQSGAAGCVQMEDQRRHRAKVASVPICS